MPGAGILPVALYKNKLYFLFGKENPMEDSHKGFADFGGGIDAGENTFESALREASEETSGFLGNPHKIEKHVRKHGGYYKIHQHHPSDPTKHYTTFIVHYDYDENLPMYYNDSHEFLWRRMDKKMLNDSKLFEKIKIEWFCEDDLKKRMLEYRGFYRNIVDQIIQQLEQIRLFVSNIDNRENRRNRTSKKITRKSVRNGGNNTDCYICKNSKKSKTRTRSRKTKKMIRMN